MSKSTAFQKLNKALGRGKTEYKPEDFIFQLSQIVVESNKQLTDAIAALRKDLEKPNPIPESNTAEIKALLEANNQANRVLQDIKTALANRKLDKVVIDRILPPEKIKVDIQRPQSEIEENKSWWQKTIGALKAPIDDLVVRLIEQIQYSRTEQGAIAVTLVDPETKEFYKAVLSVVSAGSGGINTSDLAKQATLSALLTEIQLWSDGWISTRANYTAAQTNTAIVTAGSSEQIRVKKVSVMADKANTVDVQARIGFGATTTPTGDGTLLSHPGIAAGSGVVEFFGEKGIVGATGDDVRITSEVPTTGSIDVLLTYKIISV